MDDLHFSVREEFNHDTKFQVDNFYSMDAYRVLGSVDFHSDLRVTNDLNLLDEEALQLTLAYVTVDRLWGHLNIVGGRQLFTEGFGQVLGDGIRLQYQVSPMVKCAFHFGVPFDAESEAIEDEPVRMYGLTMDMTGLGQATPFPVKLSAQVERREHTVSDGLTQTLLGLEALSELSWHIDADLYTDLEYETQDSRMRRVRFGTQLYPTPQLFVRVEGERYEPEKRHLNQHTIQYLQDEIMNYFARSAITSGRIALTYLMPKNRNLVCSYSGQGYTSREGGETFGNGVDLFFTFLTIPSRDASLGCGYSGRFVEGDYIHLGIVRSQTSLFPMTSLALLVESGVLNNLLWEDELVLHARATLRFQPYRNLEVSGILEENRNPYFDSDLRGMMFIRYLWAGQVRK